MTDGPIPPEWIARAEPEDLVCLTRLDADAKRQAWQTIQRRHPALAALLREAPLQHIARAFDAEISVERASIEEPRT